MAANILAAFPYANLTPVAILPGQPTFESLTRLQQELDANARSIKSSLGNGRDGHLVLTQTRAALSALPGYVDFVIPAHPGNLPEYPAQATEKQIRIIKERFDLETKQFEAYYDTDLSLKKQLLQACPDLFLEAIRDPTHGFALLTTLDLVTHLWTHYGRVSREKLHANTLALLKPSWSANDSIEALFKEINQRAQLGRAANSPYPDTLLAEAVYQNVAATGLFTTRCELWRSRIETEKTYLHAQEFFRSAYSDLNRTVAVDHGYHSAMVATTSNVTLAAPTACVTKAEVEALIAAAVQTALGAKRAPRTGPAPFYCWSHGESTTHDSARCLKKLPGHQDAATSSNKMGGSARKLK
jgi:hypothetical protein